MPSQGSSDEWFFLALRVEPDHRTFASALAPRASKEGDWPLRTHALVKASHGSGKSALRLAADSRAVVSGLG